MLVSCRGQAQAGPTHVTFHRHLLKEEEEEGPRVSHGEREERKVFVQGQGEGL